MRCPGPLSYALTGSAVLALLAGCSGGGSSTTSALSPQLSQPQGVTRSADAELLRKSPRTSSVLRPGINHVSKPDLSKGFVSPDAAVNAAIIISDSGTNTVNVYGVAGKLLATLTGFSEPQGLATNPAGDVFIADTANSQTVVIANDFKTVKAKLTDPNEYPAGVDFYAPTGLTGVTNIIATDGSAGGVSFYAKGSTSPCVTITDPNWAEVFFGAFDASGNLYVDGFDSNFNVSVGVVTGGCKATAITKLSTGNALSFPGGIQVLKSGQIVVDDQSGFALYTYNAPSGGSLGSPVVTTPLSGASDAVTFAFKKYAQNFWTADAGLAEGQYYGYPAGGSPSATITGLSLPIGVAITPLQHP